MTKKSDFPYLHGFSEREQLRLREQAEFLEPSIFKNIDFTDQRHIIEVGSGVGAQTEILLRRFPALKVTGIDLNQKQIEAAEKFLGKLSWTQGRYQYHQMSAEEMTFAAATFDGAYLCWILEHVPNPVKVLSEVRRVLKKDSKIFVTEVMNSTLFLEPFCPNVWKYWLALNDYQFDQAGDPYVGVKLGNYLREAGFHNIITEVRTFHLDSRQSAERKAMLVYWTNLMLSASDILIHEKYIDAEMPEKVKEELQQIAENPRGVFMYSYMQAVAQTP